MKPPAQKILSNALKYLSIRPRSRQEILDYLRSKTSDSGLIEETITRLEQAKLINDAQFAAWLVESRSRHKPRGKRLIARELKAKGISEDLISRTTSSSDEKTAANLALQKKLPLWRKLSFRDYRLKATRFLASRGFSWSVIEEVVKIGYNTSDVN